MNNVIRMVEHLRVRLSDLEFITQSYHEFKGKKETDKFKEFVSEKINEINKNRAGDSVPDDRRQKVSKSVQSDNS